MIANAIISTLLIITYPTIDKESNMGGDASPGTGTGFGGATTFEGEMGKYSGRAAAYGKGMFGGTSQSTQTQSLSPTEKASLDWKGIAAEAFGTTAAPVSEYQSGTWGVDWGKEGSDVFAGKSWHEVDLGAILGATLGMAAPIPGMAAVGYKVGQKFGWKDYYQADPVAAEKAAQEFASQYEGGDISKDVYEKASVDIREAKAIEANKPKTTEELAAEKAKEEELKAESRARRLASGRGGLLYQGDESGVDGLSTKLGG